jgi:hypothetical protein
LNYHPICVTPCVFPLLSKKLACGASWPFGCIDEGLLSFGEARELARLSRWAFHELLATEGILRHYDLEELEADLATLEALG